MKNIPRVRRAECLRESWTAEEDRLLTEYVQSHAGSSWMDVPRVTGLLKSSYSCHIRWLKHLSPERVNLDDSEKNFALLNFADESGISFEELLSRGLSTEVYNDAAILWVSYTNYIILPVGIANKCRSQEILPVGVAFKCRSQEIDDEREQYSSELELSSYCNERDATCIERNHTNVGQINSNPIQPTTEYGLHIVNKDVIQIDSSENNDTTRNDTHGDDGTDDDQNYSNESDATCIERNHTNVGQTNSNPIQPTSEYGLHIVNKDVIQIDSPENNDTTRNDTHGDDDQNYNRLLGVDATENVRDDATIINQNDTNVEQAYTIAVPPIPQDDLHIQNKSVVQVDYPENVDSTCNDRCDDHEDDNQNKIPGYITTKICISLEDLKKHFDMNLEDAAESLHVSRSSLKRVCRDYGIKRWPCRKRRKINHRQHADPDNVNKLVQKNKDHMKQSTRTQAKVTSAPGNTSNSSSASNVIIKTTYGEDIIKFRLSVSSGVTELREKISTRLELEMRSFRLKYKDNAGDLVLITCDEDLHYFFGGSSLSKTIDQETTFDIFVFPISSYKG